MDEVKEYCGVFGIYSPNTDVARLTYFGLFALQHRGQESAGIAVSDRRDIVCYKEMGLVSQVFNEKILNILKGDIAIGHVRYSTTGSSIEVNAQPILVSGEYPLAIAHNGNLVNTLELKRELDNEGIKVYGTSDSELMAKKLSLYYNGDIVSALLKVLPSFQGAYTLVILTKDKLIGVRDPYGIRPLVLGRFNGSYVLSSESCGLDIIGARFIREILPGEMVIIDESGIESIRFTEANPHLCIFELVYFARPDSKFGTRLVHEIRQEMGRILAKEAPADADLVIPVPDSGVPAAIGYSQQSGIPFSEGLIKNRYVGRTFIQPDQRLRELGVKLKLNPLKEVIEGKRIVLVDDSIVRGTTSSQIVNLLRESGAKEVHMRVSSPPITYPCFYGIDTAERKQLIAAYKSIEEVKEYIGSDTLKYLSVDGLLRACKGGSEGFCTACFTGKYCIEIPKAIKITKGILE
ncbi:MAG: amidophosphoribosyltransferase [bacterium]|nr:amidophosphoribosyltransferase [bacterium]